MVWSSGRTLVTINCCVPPTIRLGRLVIRTPVPPFLSYRWDRCRCLRSRSSLLWVWIIISWDQHSCSGLGTFSCNDDSDEEQVWHLPPGPPPSSGGRWTWRWVSGWGSAWEEAKIMKRRRRQECILHCCHSLICVDVLLAVSGLITSKYTLAFEVEN